MGPQPLLRAKDARLHRPDGAIHDPRHVLEGQSFDLGEQERSLEFLGEAQECPLDKLGRILIPPVLRSHARLEKDVVWAGMVKVIELWSRDGWRKAQDDARDAADSADVMRVLTELRQGREQS